MLFLFPERTWERPLESLWIPLCVSIHKSKHSARVYLRSVTSGRIVCYPITATSRFWMCHTICWMVLCQAFLSLLPPLPSLIKNLVSPIPLGRPDTQASQQAAICWTELSVSVWHPYNIRCSTRAASANEQALRWNGWETLFYRFLLAFLNLTVHNVQ